MNPIFAQAVAALGLEEKKTHHYSEQERLIFARVYGELERTLGPHENVPYYRGEKHPGEKPLYPIREVLQAIQHVILDATDSQTCDTAARSRRILDDVQRQRPVATALGFTQPDAVRRDLATARLTLDREVFSKIFELRDKPAGMEQRR